MLTPVPHPLHIDTLREIPDFLGGVDRVVVGGVHDAGVVEDDVDPAELILGFDGGGDGGFGGDVADCGCEAGVGVGDDGGDLGEGFVEGGAGYVGHEHGGAFEEEEDGGFETDAAGWGWGLCQHEITVWTLNEGERWWRMDVITTYQRR